MIMEVHRIYCNISFNPHQQQLCVRATQFSTEVTEVGIEQMKTNETQDLSK